MSEIFMQCFIFYISEHIVYKRCLADFNFRTIVMSVSANPIVDISSLDEFT